MFCKMFASASVALLASAACSSTFAAAIAINNASFEGGVNNANDLDPNDWGIAGMDGDSDATGTTVSTNYAHDGVQSLRMDALTDPAHFREAFNPVYTPDVNPNTEPVTFSFWAYTPVDAPISNLQLVGVIELKKLVNHDDPSQGDSFVPPLGLMVVQTGNPVDFPDDVLTPGQWKQYSMTSDLPSDSWDIAIFHIKIENMASGSTGVIYFDDASAFTGEIPEPLSASLASLGVVGMAMGRRRSRSVR